MKTTIKTAIVALALAVSVGASAESYMFNKNLTVGARGADVTALQDRLTAEGVYTYGVSTGYFGTVTKNAVKAYQAKYSISPVSGFVGPLTRASLNNAAPTTTSTTPGCTNGAMFSSTTGAPCSTTTGPVVLNGQEGFAEYRVSPTPVNDSNIQRTSDVAVYGVNVKAKNSDVAVERITIEVTASSTNGTENPSTLINSISVKDGSTVLATIPVNSTTFSKVTASSTYYLQISGLSTRVAKDTEKTFTVYFNTNSIDIARTVNISVPANGVRVVDGRGISTYNGTSIESKTHVFKKAGASTLTLKGDATTIYAQSYRINNATNGAEKVLTSTFAVKSETGPAKLTTVTVTVTASGTSPTNLYLYQGSTLLDARTVSGGTATFNIDNSNITVAQDTTSTFTIKADMPSTTAAGSAVKTTVTAVTYDKADGSSSTATGSVAGPFHFFATVVPMFSKVSSTITATNSGTQATTSVVTADIKLNLVATGGDISVASTTAVIGLKNSAGTVVATTTVVGQTDSGVTTYTEGVTRPVKFTAVFPMSSYGTAANTVGSVGTGSYTAVVQTISYSTSTTATQFNLTAGFEPLETDNSATVIR